MGWRRGKITASTNADAIKLPARLARLTRYLAVILVRKSFAATAASSSTAISAAATIATRTTVAGAATRTARAARFGFGTSFIHLQIAPTKIFAVESGNGFGRIRVVDHFHEAEAARFSGFAVGGHMNTSQLPERLEQRPEIRSSSLKTHVADKKILHAHLSLNDLLRLLQRLTAAGLAT
jgi:hypothetical protein